MNRGEIIGAYQSLTDEEPEEGLLWPRDRPLDLTGSRGIGMSTAPIWKINWLQSQRGKETWGGVIFIPQRDLLAIFGDLQAEGEPPLIGHARKGRRVLRMWLLKADVRR